MNARLNSSTGIGRRPQGNSFDLGGDYRQDMAKRNAAMRPSKTLNGIIDAV